MDNKTSSYKLKNIKNSNIVLGKTNGNIININSSENDLISEIVNEINRIAPNSNTPQEHMLSATNVVEYIEENSNFSRKLMKAIKDGGIDALSQALNHPASSFIIGAIKSWKESECNT